ncbi:MAG: PD40 domain-containing protein [Actinobacteria bacterium]|nr:PD40 domain-containing protein [Actinomycetota bacterium]
MTPTPAMTPAPTAAALAIVSGVTVVGDAAAFSPDGEWFAFTARPADGSAGPDIYLWHVGDRHARAVTTDHRSVFASWAGEFVIGSRPGVPPTLPAAPPGAASASPITSPIEPLAPVNFTIDPGTGTETRSAVQGWRPAVDPTGKRAVVWDGSVRVADDGRTITLKDGRLVLVTWSLNDTGTLDPAARIVGDGPISDFTVRWDETGSWLALWLADADDPAIGRLSLLHLDPGTGKIDRPAAGPQDVPAMPGFSIESGRLAWASPPSQDGEGSHVQIVAWSVDGVGSIESAPGQDVVVVR